MPSGGRLGQTCFELIHQHQLVYNTCWEDPRIDREALRLGPDDRIVMITSAGCNALDYALDGPRHIDAIDLNPRQNALLELKQAAIRALDFDDFFALFGRGRHAAWPDLYRSSVRAQLSPWARTYWDARLRYFAGNAARDLRARAPARSPLASLLPLGARA